MSKTLVTAGIVAYGGADEVARAARSLAEHTRGVRLKLMIFDNDSPDGAGAELEKTEFAPNVQVLRSERNLGFGTAHNRIFRALNAAALDDLAKDGPGEGLSKYHVVVNPDITLDGDTITAMCEWMDAHPDVVMAGPRLLFPDGREQHTAKRSPSFMGLLARQFGFLPLKKFEEHYLMLDEDLSGPTDVEFCSGCFFVMRSDVYCKMGGFDQNYFVYVEDADITRQALRYGRVMYLPQFSVYHAWHRDARRKLRNFSMQIKSMFMYWSKWGFRLK